MSKINSIVAHQTVAPFAEGPFPQRPSLLAVGTLEVQVRNHFQNPAELNSWRNVPASAAALQGRPLLITILYLEKLSSRPMLTEVPAGVVFTLQCPMSLGYVVRSTHIDGFFYVCPVLSCLVFQSISTREKSAQCSRKAPNAAAMSILILMLISMWILLGIISSHSMEEPLKGTDVLGAGRDSHLNMYVDGDVEIEEWNAIEYTMRRGDW